ncbi:hypothetical protein [Portibacter marinus]|uniref:hypothetical protein n=1 Tax=Portibacter marinus TaxID=2898660 RepID=UPI001F39766D|nr:hypothetical protein [Portibacter marinus]
MNKAVGGILIVLAIVLGYMGYNKVSESTASAEILGLEVSASDESGKTSGYIMLGLGVACLVGGVVMLGRKS